MKIRIYQIDLDKDENAVAFNSMEMLLKYKQTVDPAIYDLVYEASVDTDDLEDVYRIFNIAKPEGYTGRSLSVSDVVEVIESEQILPGFYFCDNIGFKRLEHFLQ